MENTYSSEYHSVMDELVSFIKDSTINEAKIFANWVNNLFLHHDEILTNEEFNKIKKPEEVLPMLAESIERDRAQLKKEGLEEGKKKIAINLLKSGSELEFVSKMTGFTITELQDLIK